MVKAYSESFEEVDPGVIEALRASGASWWQVVFSAVVPEKITEMLSWTFIRFEINFVNAVAVGAVAGAGGVGYQLFLAGSFYLNIHEVCERVRSIVLAEYPQGLTIKRDYDLSLPEISGDKEQLIQAVLNIAQNAVHALSDKIRDGNAELVFKTRVSRQVTLAKVRYRLALNLHIIDNGPGIAPEMIEKIFFPLVSGSEGGSGLGLTLSQTIVRQHGGLIECESRPGRTEFLIRLPIARA